MNRTLLGLLMTLLLLAAACSSDNVGNPVTESDVEVLQPDEPVNQRVGSFAGTDPAPEFPGGLDWLNVERPLTFAELRGKVVVLDFWTYGCINCIHVIPDLKRLESEYPDELVVIGVHSAKFANEGETDNIRDVIARYDLEHPVVNDAEFRVWNLWGAQAWPTLVLIDPAGNVVGGHSGEGIYPIFQPVIDSLIEEFDETGRVDRTRFEVVLEKDAIPDSVLSFPGKVLVDDAENRLFVADTNHHRIVTAALDSGEVLDVAGSGAPGFADGAFDVARFDQPQGMALSADGSVLYVADTGNHAIRQVDLENRTVATLLGTGQQAPSYPPYPGADADVPISSPWDVERDGTTLYVAMAGSHQLWTIDLETGYSYWFAGTGAESTLNGPRLDAELAQPSGIAVLSDGRVAFADSESSSIRYAEVGPAGETGVLVGSDANLFDFGDVDGVGTAARLQHPLGIEFAEGFLWIADTYNSKIKRLDPNTREIVTHAGGEQGFADGSVATARFSEPGGLSYANGLLYVADTNNHAIRVIDLDTGEVATKVLFGIERFPSADSEDLASIDLGTVDVASGFGSIALGVELPDGYKINDIAPSSVVASGSGARLVDGDSFMVDPQFPVVLDAEFAAGPTRIEVTTYYCSDDAEALCFIDRVVFVAEIAVVDGADDVVALTRQIPSPGR